LVEGLAGAGLDLLHVSTDGAFKGWFDPGKPLGAWVKGMTTIPVIVAGGLRQPADAERVLTEGIADFAAVGTAMLRDAEWSRHARETLQG
jgi:2,4-dienoyl-CoA reductase-like NADH-dependent reductase (Old Yellow Enzyme family)